MEKDISTKKGFKDIIAIVLLIASLALYVFVAGDILKNGSNRNESYIFGYKPMVIVSGSMEPVIKTNSMVVVKKAPYSEMEVDDIILYKQGDNYIVHRVIEKSNDGILTKGDNNDFDDGYLLAEEDVRGKIISIWNSQAVIISAIMSYKALVKSSPIVGVLTIGVIVAIIVIIKLIKNMKKE